MRYVFELLHTLVRLAQLSPQVDLVDDALRQIPEHADLVVRPRMRLAIDDAERAKSVPRHHQGNAGVRDDLQITNGRIVAVRWILPRVGDDERLPKCDGVF